MSRSMGFTGTWTYRSMTDDDRVRLQGFLDRLVAKVIDACAQNQGWKDVALAKGEVYRFVETLVEK